MKATVTTVMMLLALSVIPAAAQPAPDTWQVTLEPYLMGAGLNGTVGVKGLEAEVDASFSDLLSNLEFGAMGIVAARKGNWGVGADVIFMALGAEIDRPATEVDFNQTALAFYGLRRLGNAAEATFGLRVNGFDGGIEFPGLNVEASQDKWWVDPIVGLRLHSDASKKVSVHMYGEVGGFGVGSDFAWQVFPVARIRLSRAASLDLGYRWLGTDYTSGEGREKFTFDAISQGPVVGFGFRF